MNFELTTDARSGANPNMDASGQENPWASNDVLLGLNLGDPKSGLVVARRCGLLPTGRQVRILLYIRPLLFHFVWRAQWHIFACVKVYSQTLFHCVHLHTCSSVAFSYSVTPMSSHCVHYLEIQGMVGAVCICVQNHRYYKCGAIISTCMPELSTTIRECLNAITFYYGVPVPF